MGLTALDRPLDTSAALEIAQALNQLGPNPNAGQAYQFLDAAWKTEQAARALNLSTRGMIAGYALSPTTLDNHVQAVGDARADAFTADPSDSYPKEKLSTLCAGAVADYQTVAQSGEITDGNLRAFFTDALYYASHPIEGVDATIDAARNDGRLSGPGTGKQATPFVENAINTILDYGAWIVGGVVIVTAAVLILRK